MLTTTKPELTSINRRRIRSFAALFVLALGSIVFAGCNPGREAPVRSETEETAYRRGESLLREGRNGEALAAFLRVAEARRDAPESHLHAGRIYLEHIGDPIAAIHHFRKYLELNPESERAHNVRQLIETAQKQFMRMLPGQPDDRYMERVDLLDGYERLQAENLELKRQLAVVNRELSEIRRTQEQSRPSTQASNTTIGGISAAGSGSDRQTSGASLQQSGSGPRTYTVRGGDTLSRISTEVYGTPARWNEIYEANRDQLPNPHSLKVGQELRIP